MLLLEKLGISKGFGKRINISDLIPDISVPDLKFEISR